MPKVLVIGLDGATFSSILPMIKDGTIPTFGKLIAQGTYGTLKSTIPPITCPAWHSMLTGMNPGKLGFIDFSIREQDGYRMNIIDPDWNSLNPIWRIVSNNGLSNCIINVPTTKVPDFKMKGVFVSGNSPMGVLVRYGRKGKIAYPDWLNDNLVNTRYEVDYGVSYAMSEKRFFSSVMKSERKKINLAIDLFKNQKWDLGIFCLFSTDSLAHAFWKYQYNACFRPFSLKKIYSMVDTFIEQILASNGKDVNIIIVSDHGQVEYKRQVNINSWLGQNGYMQEYPRKQNKISRIHIYKFLKLLKLISAYRLMTSKAIFSQIDRYYKKKIPLYVSKPINWAATQAYSVNSSAIWINRRDREPHGIVSAEEYDRVRDLIMKSLALWRDPETNENIAKGVWKREELYSGPLLDNIPDIIIDWENGYFGSSSDPSLKLPQLADPPTHVSSTHNRDGIFIAYGPDIRNDGAYLGERNILDITPTILHILGLQISNSLDGGVMRDLFRHDTNMALLEPRYSSPQPDEKSSACYPKIRILDDDLIREKLKQLGYVDY